jgi:integrase
MTDRRRTKGKGTIRLRSDGRYEGLEPPEIVPLGEKPRSFYGKSEQEVARKIRQSRREREQGLNARSRQTVAAYLESWLAGPLEKSVARTTHQQYAALVRNYLLPGIGRIKLTKITAQDLDDLYADMEAKGVGERTARYVHQVASAALERAAKESCAQLAASVGIGPGRSPDDEADKDDHRQHPSESVPEDEQVAQGACHLHELPPVLGPFV